MSHAFGRWKRLPDRRLALVWSLFDRLIKTIQIVPNMTSQLWPVVRISAMV